MKNNFSDLNVSPRILKALLEMGFESPTEVQNEAIPHILNKEDLIVSAKTGSGKTAVFGIPILEMVSSEIAGPQALILEPTRELAVQVDNDIKKISKYLPLKTTAVYGQHSMNSEIQAFNRGVAIVSGTPGRVYDHIRQGNLITKNIRFLVLDEADRMLDMGFIEQVERIVKTLPKNRVTLLFSATMPTEIRKICREYMKNPLTIEIESQTKTVDAIKQAYYRMERNEKLKNLNNLLLTKRPESCMIFCNTRIGVDQVHNFLYRKGYSSEALHGEIPQGRRMKTIQQFKQGEVHLLVATDVAARGIHIDGLSLVINYDVPLDKDSYVHRIGRTGRAGNGGCAITFVTGDDLMNLYEIEEHIGELIPEEDLPYEAVNNEQRAESDKWMSSKRRKIQPPTSALDKPKKPVHKPHSKHSDYKKPSAVKPLQPVENSTKIETPVSVENTVSNTKPKQSFLKKFINLIFGK